MGLIDLQYGNGQTPLDEDEREGLLIPSVTTREELDEVEQRNIEEAIRWTIERRKRFTVEEVMSEHFIKEVHVRMFGHVWKWSGTFRNSNKNIGVDKHEIGIELRKLLDDSKFWISHKSFDDDEIAIQFKHRIVSIHCFANGNGRHSRLMADIVIEHLLNSQVFTWGSQDLVHAGEIRDKYLAALRKADKGNFKPLIGFARS